MAAEKGSRKTAEKGAFESSVLERIADELNEIQESDLLRINTDLLAVVSTADGIRPKVDKLMDRIRKLPELRIEDVEKFGLYTDALYEAHADYLSASRPPELLEPLIDRATEMRDLFYADVQALIARGLVNPDAVRVVRTNVGYKALALDLRLLTDAVKDRWTDIQGHTGIKWEELREAEQLATKLRRAVGEKEQAPALIAEASARRSKAYALFMRSYEEVGRAVSYLQFHEGNADEIVPSFWEGRGGRKKAVPDAPTTDVPAVVVPATPIAPSAPVATPIAAPAKTAT